MWNWIKKNWDTVVTVAAVVVAIGVTVGTLGVGAPMLGIAVAVGCGAGAITGGVKAAVEDGANASSIAKGVFYGAAKGAAIGLAAGGAAWGAGAVGLQAIGALNAKVGLTMAAEIALEAVPAVIAAAAVGFGADRAFDYMMPENQQNHAQNQNQQNTNQKQEADEALTKANKLWDESKDAALTKTQKLDKLAEADKFYKLFKGFYGIRDQDKKFFQDFDKTLTSLKQEKAGADEALTKANKLWDESKDAALTKTQKLDKLAEADKFYKLFKGFYGIRDQDKKFFQDFDKTLTSLKQEKAGADEALEKANALKTQGDSSVTKAEKLSKLRDAVTEYTKYTAFYGTNNEAGCTKTALEAQIRILTSEQQKALELINIGNELCHAGEYLKAIKEYDKAIAFSDSAICHLYKAKALISLGNHQEAIDELDLVLEIDPSNIKAKEQKVLAYTAKAKVENENEDYSEAIKSADAALNIDHDNSDAKSQKIHSYIAQAVIAKNSKDYTKVCSLLETAILIDENHDQIQVIKRILESSRKFLVLQQENLSLHEKISKEKEKHAQLRDDIDAIKVKQSDIGIDKQFDIDNDFITRDILMTVYGQENKSPFTISLSGESAEEVDISNS